MDAWGYVIAVVIGAVIGAAAPIIATTIQSRGERKERQKDREEHYKQMLYPKLLEVSQEAFCLLRKLASEVPPSIEDMKEARTTAIVEAKCQMEEWWAEHRFYLGEESQFGILYAIGRAEDIVHDYAVPNDSLAEWDEHKRNRWQEDRIEFYRCIRNTVLALEKGVGMKHIEKPTKEKPEGKS